MPRFIYWTILIGTEPTAFRARDRIDLVPTLKQLQRRHPQATLMWFERGKLWQSPQEARAALVAERQARRAPSRPPTWRPGGEHRDPRDRFKKPREQRRSEILRRLRRKGARADARPAATGGAPAIPSRRPTHRPKGGPPGQRGGQPGAGRARSQTPGSRPGDTRTRPPGRGRRR